jgi:hypothetical protein
VCEREREREKEEERQVFVRESYAQILSSMVLKKLLKNTHINV